MIENPPVCRQLLTAEEAAKQMKVCSLTLRFWAWDGIIPYYHISQSPRFSLTELQNYLYPDPQTETPKTTELVGAPAIASFLQMSAKTIERNIHNWPHRRRGSRFVCDAAELLAHLRIAPLEDQLTSQRRERIRRRLAKRNRLWAVNTTEA